MPSPEIIELLHSIGAGTGTVGAFISGVIYKRFKAAESSAKSAKTAATAIGVKLEVLSKDLRELKSEVQTQFAAIARGSKATIEFTMDSEIAGRFQRLEARMAEMRTQFETRTSSLEDDFDRAQKEDKEWSQDLLRSLGQVEGRLAVLSSSKRGG
jgi:hypothetical protein